MIDSAELATEHIEAVLPTTRIDSGVLLESLQILRSSSQHFWAESEGGVIAAQTDELLFSKKKQSTLVFWAGTGDGVKHFLAWVMWFKKRPAIRVATYTPLFDHPHLERFLLRQGFCRRGGMFIWER